MRFVYAAQLEPNGDAVVVSFRDLPECLNSGADEADALEDALEEAVAGRIDDNEPIPVPSPAVSGEHLVVLPADMAAKAALAMAFRDSGLTRVAFARRLGKDETIVRRMLDPRHGTAAIRINKALWCLGKELIVEVVQVLRAKSATRVMYEVARRSGGASRILGWPRETVDRTFEWTVKL